MLNRVPHISIFFCASPSQFRYVTDIPAAAKQEEDKLRGIILFHRIRASPSSSASLLSFCFSSQVKRQPSKRFALHPFDWKRVMSVDVKVASVLFHLNISLIDP